MSAIDSAVVDAKLRELSRRLRRIAAKTPASEKPLATDEDLQDILSRNLELAIQTCIDIAAHVCGAHGLVPTTAGEAFTMLAAKGLIERPLATRMRQAVGLRNVLVHEYTEVDWKLVHRALRTGVRDLGAFGKAMLALLERSE